MEFWAVLPDKVRVDKTESKEGTLQSTAEVTVGTHRLKRVADGNIEVDQRPQRASRSGDSLPNDFRRHFDRSLIRRLFASLMLEHAGECRIAGRDCVRIRAVPIPVDQIWPHWLPTEADEYEFAADLEFPALLSIDAKLAGESFERFEVTNVTYNGEIDESLFELEPLSGQQVRDAVPVAQPITLEAAKAKVSFAVLLPKMGPEFGELQFFYERPRQKGDVEGLSVFYHAGASHRFWFHLRPRLESEMYDRLEWEDVEVAGRRYQLSDPQVEDGLKVLVFNQDGTWVDIYSDHPRDELLRLAASFKAVR
jgi:hypothetical protein